MIKVIVNNSHSQIVGLTVQQFQELRLLLSYEDDPKASYYAKNFYNRRKYMIDKRGSFPTGLLQRVEQWASKQDLKLIVQDDRIKPKTNKLIAVKGIAPYQDQIDACEYATKRARAGVIMPTGSGKSLVIAMIAGKLNVKTLVVVPNLEIKTQLTDAMNQFLGKGHKVTVKNIDSKFSKTEHYDCLIIDEVHHAASKTYQNLNKTVWAGIYYRYFFSATYYRNNESEQLLFEGIAGSIAYRLTYQDAVKKGYIVPVEAYAYTLPKKQVEGYTWSEVYKELVVDNADRNGLIARMLLDLNSAGVYALCLVKEIAHGNLLSELTGVPFANGQSYESRQFIKDFNAGKIKTLIGTNGIMSEGVDTKPCEYVIIAGLGKAKSAFQQQVGRAVRKYKDKQSAKVIIFDDKSHKWTKAHFKAQQKYLLEFYGVDTVKLDV